MHELAATDPQSGRARSVTRRCRVLALSLAAYDRRHTGQSELAPDAELRDQIPQMVFKVV